MSVAWLLGTALSALQPTTTVAVDPAAAPALADECSYPDHWAPPFTHAYHLKNGATVVFVATQHSRDPADDTHRLIRAAFDRYRPSFVLVEGAASSKSSTDAYRKFLVAAADRDVSRGSVQETLFTVKLASDRGIGFSGWDFSPAELFAGGLADHLTMADMLGAHLVRARVDPTDTIGGAQATAREAEYAGTVQSLGPFDYPAWYRKNYGTTFDPTHATPCGGGIAGQVAKDETRRRNINLAGLIDRYATPGGVVLVEAGANHWIAVQPYLRSIAKSWD